MIVGAATLHLVLAMALFSVLEERFAAHPSQRWWRRRFGADAALWLVHPVAAACGIAMASALIRAVPRPGFAPMVTALPLALQTPIAFVLADLGAYALHRAYHRVPLLWAFHAVHHTSKELDWLSTSRLHPVSQAVNAAVAAAPLLACGLSTRAVVVANAVIGLWAVIVHANVRLTLGTLAAVVVSPAFHRHHHASGDANLGAVLGVWDRLFRTWEDPRDPPLPAGRHRAPQLPPDDLVSLLLLPFRTRNRRTPGSEGRTGSASCRTSSR
jgi:sterol desaturase/sphingolipid hydroxylase (fatty acid hydroxylase superfamily)